MWLWTAEADLQSSALAARLIIVKRFSPVGRLPWSPPLSPWLVPHTGTHACRHTAYPSMHMCVP